MTHRNLSLAAALLLGATALQAGTITRGGTTARLQNAQQVSGLGDKFER